MPNHISIDNPAEPKAYIITGPTSGFGLATAFEAAKYGTVVLVGRNREKLNAFRRKSSRRVVMLFQSRAICRMLQASNGRLLRSFI